MESVGFDVDDYLLAKEIEIKEREANLLRIIMRCKKLGIDVSADLWNSEDEFKENLTEQNVVVPKSEKLLTSNESPRCCAIEDEWIEPRIEDFGLSERRLKEALRMPIVSFRNFKPVAPLKPKYMQEHSESIDGSPFLSLRTFTLDKMVGSDPIFDCTPEVCHLNKTKAVANAREANYENANSSSPAITPKLKMAHLHERRCLHSSGQKHFPKRHSIQSPEEPELTLTMKQLKSFVINENTFSVNLPGSLSSNSQTPEEPECFMSTNHEDFSFSDLQMPESPHLSLDWLKEDSYPGSNLF